MHKIVNLISISNAIMLLIFSIRSIKRFPQVSLIGKVLSILICLCAVAYWIWLLVFFLGKNINNNRNAGQ